MGYQARPAADVLEYDEKAMKKAGRLLAKLAELLRENDVDMDTILEFGYAKGIVTIRMNSASARFVLDRDMRAGLERQLCSKLPGTVRRFKLTL